MRFRRLTSPLKSCPHSDPTVLTAMARTGGINILQALLWLNEAHFPSSISHISKLQEPVREAIQALDHAGLVLTSAGPQGAWTSATRLRLASLADGTLSQHVAGTTGMELPPVPSAG